MNPFRSIVCAVDLTDTSKTPLKHALALAQHFHSSLAVYYAAAELLPVASALYYSPSFASEFMNSSKQALNSFVQDAIGEEYPVNAQVEIAGDPGHGVLEFALKEDADLIVVGVSGQDSLEGAVLGSVSRNLLAHSKVPVLLVGHNKTSFLTDDGSVQFKKVLCPVDFQVGSVETKNIAAGFARFFLGDLYLLHVSSERLEEYQSRIDPVLNKYLDAEEIREVHREIVELRDLELNRKMEILAAQEREDWCSIKPVVAHGKPLEEIVKFIDQENIQLVIMGHHSHKRLRHIFSGSLTADVVSRSAAPVFVVRT